MTMRSSPTSTTVIWAYQADGELVYVFLPGQVDDKSILHQFRLHAPDLAPLAIARVPDTLDHAGVVAAIRRFDEARPRVL